MNLDKSIAYHLQQGRKYAYLRDHVKVASLEVTARFNNFAIWHYRVAGFFSWLKEKASQAWEGIKSIAADAAGYISSIITTGVGSYSLFQLIKSAGLLSGASLSLPFIAKALGVSVAIGLVFLGGQKVAEISYDMVKDWVKKDPDLKDYSPEEIKEVIDLMFSNPTSLTEGQKELSEIIKKAIEANSDVLREKLAKAIENQKDNERFKSAIDELVQQAAA